MKRTRIAPWITTLALSASLATGGCASLLGSAPAPAPVSRYGGPDDVLGTIETVKAAGRVELMGSRAVRLPTLPLQSITSFAYRYPDACGGHEFRVLETGSTQILEYVYGREDGARYLIRDYVAGPSPFMQPGLWTSYDHTSDGITMMMSEFAERRSQFFPAVYSLGPITGLAAMTQRELGEAYSEALRLAKACVSLDR